MDFVEQRTSGNNIPKLLRIFWYFWLHLTSLFFSNASVFPTGVIKVGANITVSSPPAPKPSRDTRGAAEWLSLRVLRLTSAQTKTVDIKHLTTVGGGQKQSLQKLKFESMWEVKRHLCRVARRLKPRAASWRRTKSDADRNNAATFSSDETQLLERGSFKSECCSFFFYLPPPPPPAPWVVTSITFCSILLKSGSNQKANQL